MADYGLLAGLAAGIESGAKTYVDVSQKERDREIDRKKLEIDMMVKGYVPDGKGGWVAGPELQEEAKSKQALRKAQTQMYEGGLLTKGVGIGEYGQLTLTPEEVAKRQAEMMKTRADTHAALAGKGLVLDESTGLIKSDPVAAQKKLAELGLIQAQVVTEQQKPGLIRAQTKKALTPPGAGVAKPAQIQAAGYALRLENAEKAFEDIEKQGFKRGSLSGSIVGGLINAPIIGGAARMAAPEGALQQDQAERDFVNAVLRRESGAAISPSEFSSAEKQYFPRAGDTQAVLEQKRQNRAAKRAELLEASGNTALPSLRSKQEKLLTPKKEQKDTKLTPEQRAAIKAQLGIQ